MSVDEKITGVFLIVQLNPPLLIGSVAVFLCGYQQGWTFSTLSHNEREFWIRSEKNLITMSMSVDIAIRIAGLFAVTSRQGKSILNDHTSLPLRIDVKRATTIGHAVELAFELDNEVSTFDQYDEPYDEQIELSVHPALADLISNTIFNFLSKL